MVSDVCANIVPALDTSASSIRTRATRMMMDPAPEMEMCLIFTGDEPCGEHKVSFIPLFGFTGRICTPSFAENPVLPRRFSSILKERSILQDRAHPPQTPHLNSLSELGGLPCLLSALCSLDARSALWTSFASGPFSIAESFPPSRRPMSVGGGSNDRFPVFVHIFVVDQLA